MGLGFLMNAGGKALQLAGKYGGRLLKKGGNVLQQQLNPLSRQALTREARNLGVKNRLKTNVTTTFDDAFYQQMKPTGYFQKTGTYPTMLREGTAIPGALSREGIKQSSREVTANPAMRNITLGLGAPLLGLTGLGIADEIVPGGISKQADNFQKWLSSLDPNDVGRELAGAAGGSLTSAATVALGSENPIDMAVLGYAGYGPGEKGGKQLYDQAVNFFTGGNKSKKKYEDMTPLERRELYGGSGDMDAGPELDGSIDYERQATIDSLKNKRDPDVPPIVETPVPEAPPNAPNVMPSTPIPVTPGSPARPYAPGDQAGNMSATYGNGTSTMPNANPANTVLPPNAEQILQANPMQIYEQARRAAQGQDKTQMDKVRNLGLAIHRQKFKNSAMYPTDNTLPESMTAKDENGALREIEPSQIDQSLLGIYSGSNPVLDPNKFLQMQLSGRVAR